MPLNNIFKTLPFSWCLQSRPETTVISIVFKDSLALSVYWHCQGMKAEVENREQDSSNMGSCKKKPAKKVRKIKALLGGPLEFSMSYVEAQLECSQTYSIFSASIEF